MLYKYREFGEYTDKIILNSELFFATYNSFNDPFDCNLELKRIDDYASIDFDKHCKALNKTREMLLPGLTEKEYKQWLREELITKKSKVGILSMSETKENILMWSHYSDNHKGLCFGFSDDLYEGDDITRSKVSYSEDDSYDLISFINPPFGEIKRMFTIKSKHWKYEEEIRLLDLKNGEGIKKFNKDSLKEIFFGCKADEVAIKKTIQLCQLNGFIHVEFKKAKLIPGKFALDFDEINKNDYLEN